MTNKRLPINRERRCRDRTAKFKKSFTVIRLVVGVLTPGVPGPTSKLSLRVPAQMDRRETEHKGENSKGNRDLVLSCAQGGCACSRGYKRSRGRERESESLVRRPVLPRGHLLV
jgi:hypothetical protein